MTHDQTAPAHLLRGSVRMLRDGQLDMLWRMIYITEVHMSRGGKKHEHVEAIRWEHRGSPEETGESTVEEMIDWIERRDGFVHVRDRKGHDVPVQVVRPANSRPYLRTTPDKKSWKDDLLDLPRYGVMPGEIA